MITTAARCFTAFAAMHVFIITHAAFGQVPLPLQRVNATSADAYAAYNIAAQNWEGTGTWRSLQLLYSSYASDQVFDDESAILDYISNHASQTDWVPTDYNHSAFQDVDVIGATVVPPGTSPATIFRAMVGTAGVYAGGSSVDDADPENVRVESRVTTYASASQQVEVQSNGEFPTAGLGEDSATLSVEFFVVAIGDVSGDTAQPLYGTILELSAKSSWLSAYPLSPQYDYWHVDGSLSQSTSANPSASPVTVNTTLPGGIGGNSWFATEKSEVGDIVAISSSLRGDQIAAADNVSGYASGTAADFSTTMQGSVYIDAATP